MQITGISNGTDADKAFRQNKSIGTNAASIFQQVQEALRNKETDTSSTFTESDLPLQAYALPSWYNEYLVDEMIVIPNINEELFDFAAEFSKENYMSDIDPDQIEKFLPNDAMDQDMLAKQEFRDKYKDELAEYYSLLEKYFHESLRENGLNNNSQSDYSVMVLRHKRYSEMVHQSMQKRIENDPRLLELMEILGIQYQYLTPPDSQVLES